MRDIGETRYGIDHRDLVEFALARPRQAATYENADLVRQAATLYFGFIKNHPWLDGNKRTATVSVDAFLMLNGYEIKATVNETIEFVLEIEDDRCKVDETGIWLRSKICKI